MRDLPLQFIDLVDIDTRRQSHLSVYGSASYHKNALGIGGGLSHGSRVVPGSTHEADKLIAWLEDWKKDQAQKETGQ